MLCMKVSLFNYMQHNLPHMKKTGWVKRNIPDPETITEHMYRMAMLSFLVDGKENLDKTKIMQMTLIHDLTECIVGDITPFCGIPLDEKHRMKDEAMEDICKPLGDKGPEILQIFREYEKQESPEALYVKDLDRLDLLMQAYEYEKRDNIPGELDKFFVAINGKIRHPFINKIAVNITEERDKLCRNISKSISQNSKSNNLMTKTWKNKVVDSSNDILSVSPVSTISRSMKRRLLILNLILIHKILI